MLDKLIKMVKPQTAFKKICIFFLVFAAMLTVMGGNHDTVYGSSGAAGQESARIEAPDLPQEIEVGAMLAAAKAAKPEDISETGPSSKDSPVKKDEDNVKAESEIDDEASAKESEDSGLDGFTYSEEIPMSRELQEHTYKKCIEQGLEYELILAIIWRESNFNTDAVHVNANGTRDNGIMQINDVNRKWLLDKYGITDLMDPYQNIEAGTSMLGRLTKKYGAHNAMLAYQYGEGGMAVKLKQGITTSAATEKAYLRRDYYRSLIAPGQSAPAPADAGEKL